MSRVRMRNIACAALVPLATLFVVFRLVSPPSPFPSAPRSAPEKRPPSTAPSVSPTTESTQGTFSYALDLVSIDGLVPDLSTGTPVEVWVTWSKGNRVAEPERWIRDATFERIAPAVTPTGPDVVILEIPANQRAKMIWAAQYGAVSIFAAGG